ncbi:MAG TPA: hypothetical protein VM869_20370 [Enhygromyxa sp.]|nr:hypothetical protein [Enhygromyxa sp.]
MPDWKKLLDTTKKQVGEGAKIAGQGLRQAADEARKVAGIGVGSITLEPTRSSYELGDTIRGTLKLQLSEPTPAKRLVVTLRATRKRYVVQRGSDGRSSPVQRNETIVEHEVELGGERTYESGTHSFTVHIPDRIAAKVEIDGMLGDALRAAQTLRSMTESPIHWTLTGFLDIPWKRNVSKQIDLSIRAD